MKLETLIFLYSSLFISSIAFNRTRSFHLALVPLIFSEIFVSGLVGMSQKLSDIGVIAMGWVIYPFFITCLFALEYVNPPRKAQEDVNAGLLVLVIVVIIVLSIKFLRIGAGFVASVMFGYVGVYFLVIILPEFGIVPLWDERKAFYVFKTPWAFLTPVGLVEQWGFQEWLIPLILIHYFLALLWLTVDLPKMWGSTKCSR